MADKLKLLVWPAVIIVVVTALDQLSKIWAVDTLSGRPSLSILGDFLRFSLVYNVGGALGTNIGSPLRYLIVALVIVPVLGYFVYHNRAIKSLSWPLAFICAGALGNIIDRIRLGRVVDFIDIDFFDITLGSFHLDRWWTFNIADAAISCGLAFLLIRIFFLSHISDASHPTRPTSDVDSPTSIPSA